MRADFLLAVVATAVALQLTISAQAQTTASAPAVAPAPAPAVAPTATPAFATEDVVEPDSGNDLPFFPAGAQLSPPPKKPPPDFFVIAGAVGFQQLIVLEAKSSGTILAAGGYAGKRGFGFTFEYNNLAGASGFSGGVSLGRFSNALKLAEPGGFLITLLGPTLDAKAKVFLLPEEPMFVATASVDVLGLRLAKCLGSSSFHVSLRGPTLGAAAVFMKEARLEANDEPLGALVLGAMLEAGLAF